MLCRPKTSNRQNERLFWLTTVGLAAALIVSGYVLANLPNVTARQLDISVLGLAALSILIMRDARKSAVVVVLALTTIHLSQTREGHTEFDAQFFRCPPHLRNCR